MEKKQKTDALKSMRINLNTLLQLIFGALAGVFLCGWLCCPADGGGDYHIHHGPFEFRNAFQDIAYGYSNPYQWLQLFIMLFFLACEVCFFVFGAKSEKAKCKAYADFREHRADYEKSEYLAAGAKNYRAMVNDYLKVNSCFYEKKGKVSFLYKKLTKFLYYPMIVCAIAVPVCVIGYALIGAHNEVPSGIAIAMAFASMLCWFAFAFYLLVVKHRSRCFKDYALSVTAEQIRTGDYAFDETFMNYIAADEKLAKRADKMQAAGQKGVIPYIFSEPVTAVLLGGMAIYLIVVVFIVALVISIVSPDKGTTATISSANASGAQKHIVIYGPAYGARYEASLNGGGIRANGAGTGFSLKNTTGADKEIVMRRENRTVTVGWLRDGASRTVDYANDYEGERPFVGWDVE